MKETVTTSFQTIGSSTELHSVAKKLVAVSEVTGDGTNKGAKDRWIGFPIWSVWVRSEEV